MTSSKPYLIRALYEWIADNGLTPYIVLDTDTPGCIVPEEYVKDDKIVLNIAMDVVHELLMTNEAINFKARFSGVARQIHAPIESVTAIYAKENGQGMVFPEEQIGEGNHDHGEPPPPKRGKPDLKIVE